MKKYLWLLAVFFILSCDGSKSNVKNIIVLNETVATALNSYQVSFSQERARISFQNDAIASTCSEYIASSLKSSINEDLENQMIKSEYLVCDVLSLLGNRPFTTSSEQMNLGKEIATRLDLTSFSSSVYQRLEDNQFTLDQMAGQTLKLTPHSVKLESDDWFYQVSVVAIADIDQDNQQDWVLWLTDEAKQGNYRNYQTLIVHNPEPSQSKLTARSFPATSASE